MSFKFSSGQTIDTYPKVLLHQVEEKKKNFYPNRLSFENYRMKLFFLFHFYPNLTKKKSKENFIRNSLDFARRRRRRRRKEGNLYPSREPGFKRLRSRLQLAISFTRNTDAITQ